MAATSQDPSYGGMLFEFYTSFEDGAKEKSVDEASFHDVLRVKETIVNKMIRELLLVWDDSKYLVSLALLLFIPLILVLRCFVCSSRPKNAKTHDVVDNKHLAARERLLTDDSYSRTSLKAGNPGAAAICGHMAASIKYETWTPPTPWTDASKKLLPTHAKMKSQVAKVQLELNFAQGILRIENSETSFDLHQVKLHVQRTTGAVIELFVGGNKLEHTFQSAQSAAQFQHDLLAYQMVGKALMNMYHSLELVHRGSEAHEGKESVLHDNVGDSEIIPAAIAWNDVFRCLGDASSDIRAAIEQHALRTWEEQELVSLSPRYQNRRAMLGPVDFFRLFCPLLTPGSEPKDASSPSRLKFFIDLRKQVSCASLYTQAYVRGRCVVNKGWYLDRGRDALHRLSYDDIVENINHDAVAKNEYYEGIISRDVVCEIRSKKHLKKLLHSTPSPVQAYALVGFHTFRLPPEGVDHPLAHDKDPIEVLPSLLRIVKTNPDLDFFCVGLFPEDRRIAMIKLFVRTLPKGVDPPFDAIVDRFATEGGKARERKLTLFLQLGPGAGLSPIVRAGIKLVSTILSWTRGGDQFFPVECVGERTRFPGICMDNYMQLHHFGGSLQSNPALPANYVATTANLDSKHIRNMLFRFLYNRLEAALPAIIVDLSYVLEGKKVDELSERVLGTVRMVHIDPEKVAHPIELSSNKNGREFPTAVSRVISTTNPLQGTTWFGRAAIDEEDERKEETESPAMAKQRRRVLANDSRLFQTGIDDLVDILNGVQVPVRKASLLDCQVNNATAL